MKRLHWPGKRSFWQRLAYKNSRFSNRLLDKITDVGKWYCGLSKPFKSSFWFMICNFVQRSITMLTTPVFTRILPQEEYGVVGAFNSWKIMFDYILTFCFASCAIQLYARGDDRKRVLSALCGMELFVMGSWTIVFVLFRSQISIMLGLPQSLSVGLVILILSNQSVELWMGYNRYLFEYRKTVAVTLAVAALPSMIGVFCVLYVSPTAESRLLPLVAVTAVVGMGLYAMILLRVKVFYDRTIWRKAAAIGLPSIFTNLSHFVLASSDNLMINKICGTRDVAVYNIAYSVGSLIGMVTSAVGASFIPYCYQMIKSCEYKRLAQRTNLVVLFVAGTIVGIMFFGREIVLVFAGRRYFECVDLIVPIGIGLFFNYLVTIFSRLLQYQLKSMTLMVTAVGCALVNIILNLLFIPACGYRAAAYTTMVSYASFFLIHFILYKRMAKSELNGEDIVDVKKVVFICAAVVLAGIIIMALNHFNVIKHIIAGIAILALARNRRRIFDLIRIISGKEEKGHA